MDLSPSICTEAPMVTPKCDPRDEEILVDDWDCEDDEYDDDPADCYCE